MTTRDSAPVGAPCWTDLWTSDVEGSRRFYSELFGWEAQEPSPEFGGYFMFFRDGVPVAGGMGEMGDAPPTNTWSVYLSTDDIDGVLKATEAAGGSVQFPATPVADLGSQSMVFDPTGAAVGVWQADQFVGFTVLEEPGAPSWFELHTRDHDAAVEYYRSVFGSDSIAVGDTDDFRYTILCGLETDRRAGIMDASAFLPEGVPSHWSVYWESRDVDETVRNASALGGSVVRAAEDTPYGRLATLADPAGAVFKLRCSS